MARSPEQAALKAAANANLNTPPKEDSHGRRLKGPDGFVYVWTEALSKQAEFQEYSGEVDSAGFAKE